MSERKKNIGKVSSVKGSIIEAEFKDKLPSVNNLLSLEKDESVLFEIAVLMSSYKIKAIAFTPTHGIRRGDYKR